METTDIRESFDLFDSNQMGSISLHEFKVALRALGFEKVDKAKVMELQEGFSRSPPGRVAYIDFLESVKLLTAHRDPMDSLMRTYKLVAGQSGKISAQDLQRVAAEVGEKISVAEIKSMISEFDRNLDGAIDYEEFRYIMSQAF